MLFHWWKGIFIRYTRIPFPFLLPLLPPPPSQEPTALLFPPPPAPSPPLSPEPPVHTCTASTPHKHAPVQHDGDVRRGHDDAHQIRAARELRDVPRAQQRQRRHQQGGAPFTTPQCCRGAEGVDAIVIAQQRQRRDKQCGSTATAPHSCVAEGEGALP